MFIARAASPKIGHRRAIIFVFFSVRGLPRPKL